MGEVSGLVPRRNPWMPYTHMPYICHMNCMSCQLQAERDEVPRGIFFNCTYMLQFCINTKRHNTYTYISRRKWGKFPGTSRGGTHGCHTLTCHMCHMYCISKSSIDSGAQASIKKHLLFSFPLLHEKQTKL